MHGLIALIGEIESRKRVNLKRRLSRFFYENKQVYGSRRISDALSKLNIKVGRYKVRRLMADLGLKVRYPKLLKSLRTAIIIMRFRQISLIVSLQLKRPTRCGRQTLPTFGHLKAGFMWLL